MQPIGEGSSGVIPAAAVESGIAELVGTVVDLNADRIGIGIGAREAKGIVLAQAAAADRGCQAGVRDDRGGEAAGRSDGIDVRRNGRSRCEGIASKIDHLGGEGMEPFSKDRGGVIPIAAAESGIPELVVAIVDLNAADSIVIGVGASKAKGGVLG